MSFTKEYSFEQRLKEATRILAKYPDRIPIIVEPGRGSFFGGKPLELDKNKYLVPKDLPVGQLNHVIRKRLKLQEHQALFLFINNTLLPTSELIGNVYEKNKSKDMFMYVFCSMESSFGS